LIAEGKNGGAALNVLMRTPDTNAVAVYFSSSSTINLPLDKLTGGSRVTAKWANPATGEQRPAVSFEKGPRAFTSPAGWPDALLHVVARE